MTKRILFPIFLLLFGCLSAQNALLQSGPMVGYAEMKEVMLWVQTTEAAEVYIEYASEAEPKQTFQTNRYQTQKSEAFTAHLIADQVEPGLSYNYTLFINQKAVKLPYPTHFKTPPLWQWRTDPPEMKIALGSCMYVNEKKYDRPGKSYGGNYEIFEPLTASQPDFMLWLGDNIYLREVDWYSRTGILHRNTHSRSLPEIQALLASCSNYAIWDDHDFGPNNSNYTYRGKDQTREAFKLFWGNPSYGLDGEHGITSMFEWGDAEFYLMDNRYFRSSLNEPAMEREILGKEQVDWLIGALSESYATFKFVCVGGQVLNTVEKYENHVNIAPTERQRLLDAIIENEIKNVVFLTGDRHHSELSLYEKDGVKVYDFTVSPLTSGAYDAENEENALRVEGSQYGERNYGIMEIKGKREERVLSLRIFDVAGKEVWTDEIKSE